jgi:hypothetical protein
MQKKSGFILMAVLAILALALSGASVFVYATRMPDPATTDTRGLFRWLVTRDLSQESSVLQDSILSRLELELHKGLDVGDVGKQLTPVQRAQLVHNADHLGRMWFLRQVDRYFAQLDSKRLTFLGQQIDEIQRSGVAETLAKLMAEEEGVAPKNMWASLNERIRRWSESLPPDRKSQVNQFVTAVQGNLFWRAVRDSFRPAQAPLTSPKA